MPYQSNETIKYSPFVLLPSESKSVCFVKLSLLNSHKINKLDTTTPTNKQFINVLFNMHNCFCQK